MIRARTWVIIASVATVALTVGTRFWLGTDDWAGLGQWVGGIGSFAAVAVALWLAGTETRREHAREAERVRIHAYYVAARWDTAPRKSGTYQRFKVINSGTEPVLNVQPVALHANGETSELPLEITTDMRCPVLLPGEHWSVQWQTARFNIKDTLFGLYIAPTSEIEIVYEDLAHSRWRRIGNQPPTPEPKAVA